MFGWFGWTIGRLHLNLWIALHSNWLHCMPMHHLIWVVSRTLTDKYFHFKISRWKCAMSSPAWCHFRYYLCNTDCLLTMEENYLKLLPPTWRSAGHWAMVSSSSVAPAQSRLSSCSGPGWPQAGHNTLPLPASWAGLGWAGDVRLSHWSRSTYRTSGQLAPGSLWEVSKK